MPNDKDTLEEIRQALDAATSGPWERIGQRVYIAGTRRFIEDEISVAHKLSDAHLIANAPEWLRYLLQQNEQLRESRDKLEQGYNIKALRQLEIEAELEHLKTERDDYRKGLEWYGKSENHGYDWDTEEPLAIPTKFNVQIDGGKRARYILSRYPSERGDSQNERD